MNSDSSGVRARLQSLSDQIRGNFKERRRVMTFADYLELVSSTPTTQLRSSPQFLKDCFEYWGTEDVAYSWGKQRRFKLFDCPWSDRGDRLLGQEAVQNQVYRALCNFVSEGAANKLVLLHGPNGSAKSTLVRCIGRAMQAYSEKDEGALYRFNWIFPKQKLSRGDIGFSGSESSFASSSESYAHLPDNLIESKLGDELRDHPLLLLPLEERRAFMAECLGGSSEKVSTPSEAFVVGDYLQYGQLSHRNRSIFEALLSSYQGDYLSVLRHVQVERFFVSHRYREGYVTVEPQLSVDAHERQLTQDSSIAALPPALQALALYCYGGQLVSGNRGLIEFSDLLKRPLEAFKYLLTTVEQASVSLQNATLYLDLCLIGTSNEIHLSAFKEIPEFQSFKGRVELVRVPYLLECSQEEKIYQGKLREAAHSRHVAPHCAYVAALWAVMTRMQRPDASLYPENIRAVIERLGPAAKAALYSEGTMPDDLTTAQKQTLLGCLERLRYESDSKSGYEGLTGASPREMQSVLFNAASSSAYDYVSPLAILEELEELCEQGSVYAFLKQDALPGGFRDHRALVNVVRGRLLDRINEEFQEAMGLVASEEYQRVFDRYLLHVTHFCKGERMRNEATGASEEADESLMQSVEKTLGASGDAGEFRQSLMSRIGAWALDNPRTKPIYEEVFSDYFTTLKASYYKEHEQAVADAVRQFLDFVSEEGGALREQERSLSAAILTALTERFGYCEESARDMVRALAKERYSD